MLTIRERKYILLPFFLQTVDYKFIFRRHGQSEKTSSCGEESFIRSIKHGFTYLLLFPPTGNPVLMPSVIVLIPNIFANPSSLVLKKTYTSPVIVSVTFIFPLLVPLLSFLYSFSCIMQSDSIAPSDILFSVVVIGML